MKSVRVLKKKIVAPGTIKRVSVSVLIDGELTAKEKEDLTEVVSKAAGIDVNRDDQVSIVGIPFNNEKENSMQQALKEAERDVQIKEYIRMGIPVASIILVIIIMFLGIRLFQSKNIKQSVTHYRAENENKPNRIDSLINVSSEDNDKKKLRQQIENAAKENSEEVAKVLKTWLAEE